MFSVSPKLYPPLVGPTSKTFASLEWVHRHSLKFICPQSLSYTNYLFLSLQRNLSPNSPTGCVCFPLRADSNFLLSTQNQIQRSCNQTKPYTRMKPLRTQANKQSDSLALKHSKHQIEPNIYFLLFVCVERSHYKDRFGETLTEVLSKILLFFLKSVPILF